MIEETNRNVQLTMSVQSLQGRLTAMERSANALRELLRQKFGDVGIVHLIEALENLGAGSNALLEVPVSGTAEVSTADNKIGFSYESKHPDSAHLPVTGANTGSAIGTGGGNPYQSNKGNAAPPHYPTGSGPYATGASTRNAAGVGGGSSGYRGGAVPISEDEDNDPSHAYSKAIENALYR